MISDFTTDGRRRIAWHSLTNPSMAVFYPTIFYHDGLAVPPPEWLASSAPWFGFYYATYVDHAHAAANLLPCRPHLMLP